MAADSSHLWARLNSFDENTLLSALNELFIATINGDILDLDGVLPGVPATSLFVLLGDVISGSNDQIVVLRVVAILNHISSTAPQLCAAIASPDVGLVHVLGDFIAKNGHDHFVLVTLRTLANLCGNECRVSYVGSELLHVLMTTCATTSGAVRHAAFDLLFRLAYCLDHALRMVSEGATFLPTIRVWIENGEPNEAALILVLKFVWLLALMCNDVEGGYFRVVFADLSCFAALSRSSSSAAVQQFCLILINAWARHSSTARLMHQSEFMNDFLTEVLDNDPRMVQRVRAAMAMAFINANGRIGADEDDFIRPHDSTQTKVLTFAEKPILANRPELFDFFLNVLENTADGLGGEHYAFGQFDWSVVMPALVALLRNQQDQHLVQSSLRVLPIVLRVLSNFANNGLPLSCQVHQNDVISSGGGGEDIVAGTEAAKFVVAFLCSFPNIADLQHLLGAHFESVSIALRAIMKCESMMRRTGSAYQDLEMHLHRLQIDAGTGVQ